MSARLLAVAFLAVAASALSACGSSSAGGALPIDAGGKGGNTGPGSGGSAGGPVDGAAGGSTGSDASATGSGGSGGVSTTGSGGSTGAGGFSGTGGAGGSGAGGAGGRPMSCAVLVQPISSGNLGRVPAGPNATLRVRGMLTGSPQPPNPVWMWTVTLMSNSQTVAVSSPVPNDPSVIEFPTTREDHYLIMVTASGTPSCNGAAVAVTTFSPSYWVRILPPANTTNLPPALANLAPHDQIVTVQPSSGASGSTFNVNFNFDPALRVTIDPMYQNDAVPSYVLITSAGRSWSQSGDTTSAAFMTPLVDGPGTPYDVLVAPIDGRGGSGGGTGGSGGAAMFAPLFFAGKSAVEVNSLPLTLQAGVLVSGTLGIQGGAAVNGATVVLRSGALPSTVGNSDSTGAYSLLARGGRFSAVVVPPDAAMLPEAHLDADASTGIDLPASATAPVSVGVAWRADLGARTLTAHFVSGNGGPAATMDVQLDSDAGSLPDVGTFQVAGSASGSATFTATGAVHRRGTTDPTGAVTFAGLPHATYQLVAVPPVSSSDGLTVTAVDLTTGTAAAQANVNLSPKVVVRGTIVNAPAGTRIIPLDDDPTLGHVFPAAAVGSGGMFSMSLDPQHSYHLLVDPPAGAMASRVPLGSHPTTTMTLNVGDQLMMPPMVAFSGLVRAPDGATPVPGARVQVFCLGLGPDCIDESQPGSKDPLPLIEGVTSATGAFSLWVPGPAQPAP